MVEAAEQTKLVFKQSSTWWCSVPLQTLLNDAQFAFQNYKQYRLFIVTRHGHDHSNFNCFGIEVDKYGICLNSMGFYGRWHYEETDRQWMDANKAMVQFLKEQNAEQWINPSKALKRKKHKKQRYWLNKLRYRMQKSKTINWLAEFAYGLLVAGGFVKDNRK